MEIYPNIANTWPQRAGPGHLQLRPSAPRGPVSVVVRTNILVFYRQVLISGGRSFFLLLPRSRHQQITCSAHRSVHSAVDLACFSVWQRECSHFFRQSNIVFTRNALKAEGVLAIIF